MSALLVYAKALALTIAVEVPIVALVYRPAYRRMAVVCAVATTLTHLTMHFGLPMIVSTYNALVYAGEALAFAGEAAAYYVLGTPRSLRRAVLASAVANAASWAAGVALR